LNGVNPKFGSVDKNVAVPDPSAVTGAGDEPKSQFTIGDQPFVVDGTPSHCSIETDANALNPAATTVNAIGFPDPSPGTTNGEPEGCVIVDAQAIPAKPINPTTTPTATTTTRRLLARIRNEPSHR